MSDEPLFRIVESGPLAEPTADELSLSRRRALKLAAASLTLLVTRTGFAAAASSGSVMGVRVWPAKDYTRVTLEYSDELKYTQMMVANPPRLVVDIEGVEFNSVLQSLPGKISETDPYIKLIRAGRNRPGVVRLVIELKSEIKPQVFTLKPIGEYGHRLVLDLYPTEPVDPLMSMLEESENKTEAAIEQAAGKPQPRIDKPAEKARARTRREARHLASRHHRARPRPWWRRPRRRGQARYL